MSASSRSAYNVDFDHDVPSLSVSLQLGLYKNEKPAAWKAVVRDGKVLE